MQPQQAVIVDSRMSAEERAQVLNWLDASHKEFLGAIEGVSAAQWKWKPGPDRWSVGETAEHIVIAEALLLNFVQRALAASPNSAWEEQTKGKTEIIVHFMPLRAEKVKAPEVVTPREGLTQTQVRERFERQRLAIVQFATETQLPLKEHTMNHPFPIFGTLNAYQWFICGPLHTLRHGQQIAEVKATPGYPSR
jgi:uncharacterized damage-inducible protein DinB